MCLPVRFRKRSWNGIFGGALLAMMALLTLAAPWLASYDPNALYSGESLSGPCWAHPLGTDLLGRDQLARVLYGGRTALGLAGLILTITVGAGTLVGSLAGYYGGRVDELITILLNVVLALPDLSLAIALIAILGPGWSSLLFALTVIGWAGYARLFRGAILTTRRQLFVEAARAIGLDVPRILWRHILPNVARPILALASLNLASVILALASLSFLGLGVQPPTADWGTMLSDARPYMRTFPHLALAPALCIIAVSLGATLLADALLTE